MNHITKFLMTILLSICLNIENFGDIIVFICNTIIWDIISQDFFNDLSIQVQHLIVFSTSLIGTVLIFILYFKLLKFKLYNFNKWYYFVFYFIFLIITLIFVSSLFTEVYRFIFMKIYSLRFGELSNRLFNTFLIPSISLFYLIFGIFQFRLLLPRKT
jgi:hypothetical protein